MTYTFKKIKVWQKAHELTIKIYKISDKFPRSEVYGISSQLRRSSASIATNIAEGYKRKSKKDFAHFLNIADSSLEETKYYLLLCNDLGYIDTDIYNNLCIISDEIGRMLYGFQRKVLS